MVTRLEQFYRQRWQRWLGRRIPRNQEFILNQRRVFIFLSSYGGIMALLLLALFVAGINYANNLLLGLCFFLASLTIIVIHHTFANLSGLKITAVKTIPTFAGEQAGFVIRLSSHSGRFYYSLLVEWDGATVLVEELTHPQDITLFLPTQKRGRYQPPRLKISTIYPLGLLRAWTWLDMDLQAIVYPKPMASDVLPAGAGGKNKQQGEQSQQRHQQGYEDFEGLKDFVPGEPLAHISWKHLARGQGLQLKTFSEPIASSDVLDYQVLTGLDRETRLSRLAWWVERLSQQQQAFALRLPNQEIPVGTGASHREQCLTALALFEASAS